MMMKPAFFSGEVINIQSGFLPATTRQQFDFYTRALKETFGRAIEALSKADYIIED